MAIKKDLSFPYALQPSMRPSTISAGDWLLWFGLWCTK